MKVDKNVFVILFFLFPMHLVEAKELAYKYYRDKFLVVPEPQTNSDSFGTVMVCPAHAHGTAAEAMVKLKDTLAKAPSGQVSTIWVCRADQVVTLRKFAPLVDRIVVNTFALTSNQGPKENDPIWPSCDHPFLNHIRELRTIAGKKNLLACIDVAGESGFFKQRSISFEEIQWMAYALVGANYQGIIWRGDLNALSWGNRLRQLESSLLQYADDLGVAELVDWTKASKNQPISTLRSKNYLFVVLLNTEYLEISPVTKAVVLPLETPDYRGTLSIHPPQGIMLSSGKTLSGLPIKTEMKNGSFIIPYHYRGGGDIIVFKLTQQSSTTCPVPPEVQP